jgi:hypothetical protein
MMDENVNSWTEGRNLHSEYIEEGTTVLPDRLRGSMKEEMN